MLQDVLVDIVEEYLQEGVEELQTVEYLSRLQPTPSTVLWIEVQEERPITCNATFSFPFNPSLDIYSYHFDR